MDFTTLRKAFYDSNDTTLWQKAHGLNPITRTYRLVRLIDAEMTNAIIQLNIMEELYRNLAVDKSVVRLDPGSIASYAIASMGFLGAGAIIKGKGSLRGLTTAAGLWSVTGIGLSIGAGYTITAIVTAVIIITSLYLAYIAHNTQKIRQKYPEI